MSIGVFLYLEFMKRASIVFLMMGIVASVAMYSNATGDGLSQFKDASSLMLLSAANQPMLFLQMTNSTNVTYLEEVWTSNNKTAKALDEEMSNRHLLVSLIDLGFATWNNISDTPSFSCSSSGTSPGRVTTSSKIVNSETSYQTSLLLLSPTCLDPAQRHIKSRSFWWLTRTFLKLRLPETTTIPCFSIKRNLSLCSRSRWRIWRRRLLNTV